MVHRRLVRLGESATVATAVVEAAISISVMAIVGVARVEVSTASEMPVVGLEMRRALSRTLNGALKEWTTVHVEKVEVVLLVFLEVLSVGSQL